MTVATDIEKKPSVPKDVPQTSDGTYFLIVNDPDEIQAARAYVKAMYPGTKAKVVSELRIDRLTDKHTVIALTRPDERTPASEMLVDDRGISRTRRNPVSQLMAEVREGIPVRCSEFWGPGQWEGSDGELDNPRFIEALGKTVAPATVKNYPQQGLVKLAFA